MINVAVLAVAFDADDEQNARDLIGNWQWYITGFDHVKSCDARLLDPKHFAGDRHFVDTYTYCPAGCYDQDSCEDPANCVVS